MLLNRYPAFRDKTLSQAQAWLQSENPSGWVRAHSTEEYRLSTNIAMLSRLRLTWSSCSAACEVTFPPLMYVRHAFPVRNRARFKSENRVLPLSDELAGCVLPANEEVLVNHDRDYQQIMVRIAQDELSAMLIALTGDNSKTLAFKFGAPNQREKGYLLRRAVFGFAEEINSFGSEISLPALSEIQQSIIVRFLIYNTHNYSEELVATPIGTSRNRVELAEDFIRENWNQPLDFAVLSRVTNTSMRTLFRSFKELRGYSPSDFAKQLRLEQARSRIMQDSDESIIAIAMKCGFQNVGRFANLYRNEYGELPSETRKRTTSLGW